MSLKKKLNALVFDAKDLPNSIMDVLIYSGFNIFYADNSKEIIEKTLTCNPQLIILDINMPGADGIETCTELRLLTASNRTPIIFYTSQNDDYTRIAAFDAGADDYIIRPGKTAILIRRINALVKRSELPQEYYKNQLDMDSGFIIDRERYLVWKNGSEIILPKKEFELLWLLYSSPKKVFTRQEIATNVWGQKNSAENRTIEVHIRRVREKLGYNSVRTVKGIGYSINI